MAKTTSELSWDEPHKKKEWEKRCYGSQNQIFLGFLQDSDLQDSLQRHYKEDSAQRWQRHNP